MSTTQDHLGAGMMDSLRDQLRRPDGLSTQLADRIAYAHDASPIVLRDAAAGRFPALPDAIAWPESAEEVAVILRWAQSTGTPVVPYGGGSGIVGGALALRGGIVLDLKRMNRLLGIDEVSLVASAEAGINGQVLEDALNARGYTLGHLPQSIRASTLGGWIAHRAAGVASTRYGKIEDIVEALDVVLPTGAMLSTRHVPRAATGPDLDQLFLGSEGAYGVVTTAHLAVRPLPEVRRWQSYAFRGLDDALECMRRVIQRDLRPAIVRLYDAVEAAPHLEGTGAPDGAVLLLWGMEGRRDLVELEESGVRQECAPHAAVELGAGPGERWWAHRLSTAALLATLGRPASVADALEVTGSWSNVGAIYRAMKAGMEAAAGDQGRVYGHVSHVYHTGANLYMIFHATADREEDVPAVYERVLDAAFTACLRLGGSLSHHHGVGSVKARWLADEHGPAGIGVLRDIQRALDPAQVMNPASGLFGGAA